MREPEAARAIAKTADAVVVGANRRDPVKRQLADKVDERLLDRLEPHGFDIVDRGVEPDGVIFDEKGKIVKENDHLMDAMRYLIVSGRQFAIAQPMLNTFAASFEAADPNAGY